MAKGCVVYVHEKKAHATWAGKALPEGAVPVFFMTPAANIKFPASSPRMCMMGHTHPRYDAWARIAARFLNEHYFKPNGAPWFNINDWNPQLVYNGQ